MNFNYFLELYNIYNMQKLQCQSNITCGVFEIKFFLARVAFGQKKIHKTSKVDQVSGVTERFILLQLALRKWKIGLVLTYHHQ